MKKAYEAPRLENKGDIRTLTQGNLGLGTSDTGIWRIIQS
jgi:hypothetical protein